MKNIIGFALCFWGISSWAGPAVKTVENVDKSGVILQGYDAVSYFKSSQPVKGNAQFQTDYHGAKYRFASEENKQEFLKSPQKFAPQFGGWCAYAVADSKSKVDIDPQSFIIQDGRLLIFYNGIWGNTRKKWTSTKDKDAETFLKEADANWPATKDQEP